MARLKTVRKDGRAISPVIATVIIVAIAIAIAIAVAFWAVGLTGIFTRYEEVKVTSAYATADDGNFVVKMKLKNTGSADATLDDCFINGKPWNDFTGEGGSCVASVAGTTYKIGGEGPDTTCTINSGKTVEVTITIPKTDEASSGQTLDIKLHTAAGRDYPRAVVLP